MQSDLDNTTQGEPGEYGLEVLCASWNPLAAALAEPLEACQLVADVAAADAEGFLASFYRSQQG